jgi:hypothetical protein
MTRRPTAEESERGTQGRNRGKLPAWAGGLGGNLRLDSAHP